MIAEDFTQLYISNFFGLDEDGLETSEVLDVVRQAADLADCDEVDYRFGASKLVFMLKDSVIKIPFKGMYYESEYNDDGLYFSEFDYNYCEEEAIIYKEAAAAGLGQFFARTAFYGYTADKTPIYVSERVGLWYDNHNIPSLDSLMKAAAYREDNYYGGLEPDWIAIAIDKCGEEKVKELLDFINEMDINDLHCSNIGFRKDGFPVLLDYSSFRD